MTAAEAQPIVLPIKSTTHSTGNVLVDYLTLGWGKGSLVISGHDWPTDPQIFHVSHSRSADMLQQTLEQNRSYRQRIETLERQMAKLLEDRAESEPQIRNITKAQAKREIRTFFDDHDGEVLYPSDLSVALHLDYDLVLDLIEQLESEGQVVKAEA